jgi:hypothetical protein
MHTRLWSRSLKRRLFEIAQNVEGKIILKWGLKLIVVV